jgi:heat shock protein HslJ
MGQAQHVSLDHTKWKLTEAQNQKIPSRPAFTLSFEAGRISISGCNIQSGNYHRAGSKLVVAAPLTSTRKACPDDVEAVDQALSRLISTAPQFTMDANRLKLVAADSTEWVFSREASPSRQAKIKFIYVAAFTKDCTGVAPMKCLQVRDSKQQPWRLNYIPIQGFEHVPGIEYRLRIKEDQVAHPPADGSSIAWYLDAVIEQSVVDRAAAEEYEKAQK